MSNYTAYKAAKVVNEWLASEGRDKVLPAQMFYNYTKARIAKGKAPLIECDNDGRIAEENLVTWYEKYTTKQDRLTEAREEKANKSVEEMVASETE
jgi:hypothetical protein